MTRNMKWIYNAFNFLDVWLPYGYQTTVYERNGDVYKVLARDLSNPESNETLRGVDITIFHPEGNIVSPDNYKQVSIGTCTGQTREIDSLFEVRCLIKDPKAIEMVKSGEIEETSAVYLQFPDGSRVYNSIAIVPKGYAKLGTRMKLKAESHTIIMTPEDLKAIAEAVTADFKAIELADEALAAVKAEAFKEGREAGKKDAEIISTAKAVGFEGDDTSLAVNHLIDTQFPGLRSEAMSVNDLMLLVQAAMKTSTVSEAVGCKTCGSQTETEVELETESKTMAESLPMLETVLESAPVARKVLPRRVI
jgi:Uncharacterized protein conserved in bacteria (DUF2213)